MSWSSTSSNAFDIQRVYASRTPRSPLCEIVSVEKPKPQGSIRWRHDSELRRAKAELEEHRRKHRAAQAAGDVAAAQREVVEIEGCFARLGAAFYSELEP